MKLRFNALVLFLCSVACVLGSAVARADSITFDFEDQIPSSGSKAEGKLSSITLNQNGLAIKITRPGSVFDLVDNPAAGPNWVKDQSFGNITLGTFADENTGTPLIIEFSEPVNSFSLDIGDFSQDTDELDVEALSGTGGSGVSLDRTVEKLDDNNSYDKFTYKRLEVRGNRIRSIRLICGSSVAWHSMYYDNLVVERDSPGSR